MDNVTAENPLIMNLHANKIPIYPEWGTGCSEIMLFFQQSVYNLQNK